MDIHQLKAFVAVAREGSVTRASELLHLSQPAVSAHIKATEDALPLFEKTPRGMILSRDAAQKARRELRRRNKLVSLLREHRGNVSEVARVMEGRGTRSRYGSADTSLIQMRFAENRILGITTMPCGASKSARVAVHFTQSGIARRLSSNARSAADGAAASACSRCLSAAAAFPARRCRSAKTASHK